MLKIWEATNFRRTLGGLCLIVAPVLFSLAEIVAPPGGNDAATILTNAGREHTTYLLSMYAGLGASILFIPAFFALLHLLRGRGVVLGHVAAILALLGNAVSGLALFGVQLAFYWLSAPGVDQKAATTILNQALQDPAGAPIQLGHILFAFGIILFGVALWRSGFGYRWAGPLAALGIVIDIVASSAGLEDSRIGAQIWSFLSDAPIVVGFGAVGLRLLTTSDAAWESGPEPTTRPASASAVATT